MSFIWTCWNTWWQGTTPKVIKNKAGAAVCEGDVLKVACFGCCWVDIIFSMSNGKLSLNDNAEAAKAAAKKKPAPAPKRNPTTSRHESLSKCHTAPQKFGGCPLAGHQKGLHGHPRHLTSWLDIVPNIDTKWNELQDSQSESDTNFITNHGSTLILQNAGYSCWRSVFVPGLSVEVKPHHCWRILDCQRCQAKEWKRTADSLEDFQRHSWHLAILWILKMTIGFWMCLALCPLELLSHVKSKCHHLMRRMYIDEWPIRGLLDKCHAFGNPQHFMNTYSPNSLNVLLGRRRRTEHL